MGTQWTTHLGFIVDSVAMTVSCPAGGLQSSNLVCRAGNSHGNRVHNKSKVCGPLSGNEVTLFPIEAPTKDHKQKSSLLSVQIRLIRRRALNKDAIHIDGY